MDESGNTLRIVFRPDYSYHRLTSHPYIVHLTVFRRELALSAGGFNLSYVTSQDYDLLLRLAAVTDRFGHVPRVLYRWRQHEKSAGHQKMNKVMESSIRALQSHLTIKDIPGATVEPGLSFNFFRVRYPIKNAFVSIIIPTRDRVDLLRRCVTSLRQNTELPPNVRYELIVADNGSTDDETCAYLQEIEKAGHQVTPCAGPFNFSRINNQAAQTSNGDILLFLNNDIEVVDAGWLTALLEYAQRPEVGAVGAKLIYPNGLVQHAGVIIGMCQGAAHSHQFFPERDNWRLFGGHLDELLCIRECMAVTAACLMVRREVFEKLGGFDEDFVVGFGDTDLCFRIREAGFLNIWTPYARLIHYESASRGKRGDDLHLHPEDIRRLKKRWDGIISQGDPYYNPNLSLRSNNFLPIDV
ncbi:MAG: glycosyltransferase family 2 protein [Deltaproteobacteria bacterium]|nr:glycosyltransferase family 2 protein [Deltaproteobacteria bacterium]